MPNVSIQTILQNNLPKGYTGSRGDTGFVGSAGDQGYTGSLGYTGSIGYTGSAGPQGVSIRILGVLQLIADLPSDGTSDGSTPLVSGDSFIVEEDGNLYSWNGLDWVNGGRIQGYTGSVGFVGSQGDLGYTGSQGDIGYTGSQGDVGFTGSQGDLGYTGSLGGFEAVQGLNSVSDLSYTFQTSDAGKIVEFTANATVAAVIPTDATSSFLIGQRIDISQAGLGTVEVTGEAGVTLNSTGESYLAEQYQSGSIVKTGADEWLFIGPQSVGYTGSQGDIGYTGSQGEIGYSGSEGGLASIQDINEQTGTTYVLQTSDAGKLVQLTNSSDVTVVIPNDGALGAEIGQRIDLSQGGTGAVYFQLGTGVQLRYAGGDYLNEQYSSGTLIKLDVDEWLFVGPQATGYTGSAGYTGSVGFVGSQGYTGSEGTLASIQGINEQTGTTYTFVADDAGKLVTFTNTNEITVIVPSDSSLNFDVGRRIDIQQGGQGQVTLSPENGVIVYSTSGLFINQIYASGTLIKTGANEWLFAGPSAVGYTGSFGFTGSKGDEGSIYIEISSGDFVYTVAGLTGNFPTITLVRGQLYTFDLINISPTHPIALRLSSGDTNVIPGTTGNDPVNGVDSSSVTYRVPLDAPNSLVYQCAVHSNMVGNIIITDPVGFTGSEGATLSDWVVVTSNYQSQHRNRIIADSSGGSFSITLPSNPSTGDYIQITDGANFLANSITVLRNLRTIEGIADDVILDVGNITVEFIYSGTTWQVTSSSGAQGYTGSIGFTGSRGAYDAIGFTGSEGTTGYTGSVGFTGSQGIPGEAAAIGYTGSGGDLGYTGSRGLIGYTGSRGDIGEVGYTGSEGFTGSTGFTGSQGPPGEVAAQGYTGSQGDIGYTGSQALASRSYGMAIIFGG